MHDQAEKGRVFRALHERDSAFILPNPWNVGTARILERLGFEALATTSAGYAYSCGQRDNTIGREKMLAHAAEIVNATHLPVSADLENGYGDDPDTVAETVRLAGQAGLAGCSIEDSIDRPGETIYEFELAVERIKAAAEAARTLPFPFTLTGRAENYLRGRRDLDDTIRRLQAYQDAGADVIYAPGLTSRDDIASIVRSVDRPVNVLMGIAGLQMKAAELSDLGVKRISVGSALARAAFGAFLRAAREMRTHGSFEFVDDAVSFQELSSIFEPPDEA